jgi:hypothetical protein
MHISIEGDARSGRPKEAVSDKNIKKVYKIILNGRKVNLIKIAETLKISKKRVGHIVHEYPDMLKLFGKWLPRLFTIDQIQQRVDDSEQCLAIFNRNKDEFIRRNITMDVTWLLYNTPESNRKSAEWTERDEPNPKRGKTQRSAGVSTMGCACYYIHRLLRKEHQQRVLYGVNGAFKWWNQEKNSPISRKKVLFHQDNALFHKSIKTKAKLHESSYELFLHSPYSPDLASTDFFLFADLKRMLAGKKISTNEEVVVENKVFFEAISKSFYKIVSKNCMIAIIVVTPSKGTILNNKIEIY